MTRDEARKMIRESWRELYPSDSGRGRYAGIICPLCGSGSGSNGSGITENPRSQGNLRCWNCGFSGDVLDLIQQDPNNSAKDYNAALKWAAAELNITIDPYTPPRSGYAEERPVGNSEQPDAEQPQEEPARADYTEYYRQCRERITDPAAAAYLQSRGISLDTAKAYWIGYDPAWRSPAAISRGKNPPPTPRIVVPTSATHYVARDTRQTMTAAEKKYSKMNEGRPGIFNLAALYDDRIDTVFVTEGIFDALSILEKGAAAVATNSTVGAEMLIRMLEQRPTRSTLIITLDNDAAGSNAANIIRDGLTRLNINHITANISGDYKDPNEALTAAPAVFEAAITAAQMQATDRPDNVSLYLDKVMQIDIDRFRQAGDRLTGYANLDEKTGGLYAGLYVLSATTSLGKTTFMHQMADQLAAGKQDVIFFSLEQSRLELVSKSLTRAIAQNDPTSKITSLSIRRGYNTNEAAQAAETYKRDISDRLSIVEGNFNCNISFIGNYVRQYIKRTGTKPVVIIDYLQILQPEQNDRGRMQTTREAIDTTVTALKRMSRELDLTVFVISSVNRANYMQPIDFESLKESGGIEYSADVVWGLQLQCLDEKLFTDEKKIKQKRDRIGEAKEENPRKIKLLCLKNRYGVSRYKCYFDYYPAQDLFEPGEAPQEDPYGDD